MKKVFYIIDLPDAVCSSVRLKDRNRVTTRKLTAYKIAFFTQRLDLTPAEAEKFWPVYNDYLSAEEANCRSTVSR